ncbi:hypothetical protein ACFWPX_03685 [Nocardia sp. NPDC058518]|uniref:phthiocerol/phthiodiolone dimycocerosyl transferase family protein n=1 Tax=Nocardia sp. NPDC058518 TaxID=3346534 RepID=UPI00366965B6
MSIRTGTGTAVTSSNDRQVRRALSPVERWYWMCDQISPLNVVARVRVRGHLPAPVLAAAAAALTAEHPLLRVSIDSAVDGTSPHFVAPVDPLVPIRTVVLEQEDPDAWQREIDTVELPTRLDWRRRPLLRLVDIAQAGATPDETHDVVLTVAHTVADGTTALSLLRRLVELADRLRDPAVTVAEIIDARDPLPAPEQLLPKRFRGARGVGYAVAAGIGDQVVSATARACRLEPEVPVAPADRRSRLLHRELDATRLAALIERCRAEGVTVHSALAAALAAAIGEEIAPGRDGRIGVGSPIDFRAELDPIVPQQDAGAYVATVPVGVHFGPSLGMWQSARRLHRGLLRRRRCQQHLALLVTLRFLCPKSVATSARAIAMVEATGPGNVCLSNIGHYEFANRVGNWTLAGAQFIAGVSVSGFFVGTVNTTHATLHWNFTYIETVVSAARAARIADAAIRILLAESTPRSSSTEGSNA